MGSRRISRSASPILIVCAVTLLITAAHAASTTKLIYSLAGGTDGEYPDTELVRDSAGNFYGTTVLGGTGGGGTVFQVTPSGVHTVLYNFTGGADGGEPYKGVTLDSQGNLYGTAVTGGGGSCDGGCGVVFKLTNSGSGVWTQSVIHQFTGGNDGSGPGSPVAFDALGNLYGTAPTGGIHSMGVVYQLRPTATGWKLRVIHAFTGKGDGAGGSAGRLLIDASGNIYGTCTTGGVNGFGTVYEISPNQSQWHFATLYAFKDNPDGGLPYGSLVFDKAGNLYGTTYYAGAHDMGSVYKLTHANGRWTESVLYSFKGGSDGANPISSLVSDSAGNLYGTTSAGGNSGCDCGVIFKMHRRSTGEWTESVVYRFPGMPEPGFAYNGMVSGAGGKFFGATPRGGSSNNGAIYEFKP